jgi:hypothetical protein
MAGAAAMAGMAGMAAMVVATGTAAGVVVAALRTIISET